MPHPSAVEFIAETTRTETWGDVGDNWGDMSWGSGVRYGWGSMEWGSGPWGGDLDEITETIPAHTIVGTQIVIRHDSRRVNRRRRQRQRVN